ncbi:uncharacterized protein LOC142558572 [Dermacentor variabilis]|uniref:uncharacterized protein LOC142558572 n=1 Tax=Dermacentor variabilis TaxID=34621 RepID=UPI003F5BE09E
MVPDDRVTTRPSLSSRARGARVPKAGLSARVLSHAGWLGSHTGRSAVRAGPFALRDLPDAAGSAQLTGAAPDTATTPLIATRRNVGKQDPERGCLESDTRVQRPHFDGGGITTRSREALSANQRRLEERISRPSSTRLRGLPPEEACTRNVTWEKGTAAYDSGLAGYHQRGQARATSPRRKDQAPTIPDPRVVASGGKQVERHLGEGLSRPSTTRLSACQVTLT